MSDYDVVIHGGSIIDGTGTEPVRANLGVHRGTIAEISPTDLRGDQVIDATGLVVTPGFIDMHSHADFRIPGHPEATTQLPQGVTSLVGGNCGFSPFPVGDPERIRNSSSFLGSGLDWDWTDAAGYADVVDAANPAINMVAQVGHNALREAVMGGEQRLAEDEDLEAMADLLTTAAQQGVHGFSTGLIYAPGTYSDERELQHLVTAAGRNGLLYSTHIRNEGSRLTDAVSEAIRLATGGGTRLQVSHLKAAGERNHGGTAAALDLIDEAAEAGLDVAADVYPYTASSTSLTTRLPSWALDGGTRSMLARLDDADQRERILTEMREGQATAATGVIIAGLRPGPYADRAGQSLAQIAEAEGVDDAEATLRILAAHDGAASVVLHSMSAEDVARVLSHPRVAVASDGAVLEPEGEGRPHPRSFGTFPRVIARYVREQALLTLPEAIRKMTSLPASRLGWLDRGVLRPGAVADVAVFDSETFTDNATFHEPWQLATGTHAVLVAGQVAYDDGKPTGARAGRLLRR